MASISDGDLTRAAASVALKPSQLSCLLRLEELEAQFGRGHSLAHSRGPIAASLSVLGYVDSVPVRGHKGGVGYGLNDRGRRCISKAASNVIPPRADP